MKLMTTLATVVLLWAGAVKADDFGRSIEMAYTAAGYSNIVVQHVHGSWLVTADLAGQTQTFLVDRKTGSSTTVDPSQFLTDDDGLGGGHGRHGAGHDLGDDNGVDGAGHDLGDDNGVDGAGHDVGDDHGGGGNHGGGSHSGHGGSDD